MNRRTMLVTTLLLASAGGGCSESGTGTAFPDQSINLLVGFAAGGGSDQWARGIAEAAETPLGVPVQVSNTVGNGGLDAVEEYMGLAATGYNLLSIVDIYAAAYARGDTDIDPSEDLVPLLVGNIAISQIYIDPDDARFSTWAEVVAYAQVNPGLTVASTGVELDMEGISIVHLEDSFSIDLEREFIDGATERFTAPLTGTTDLLIEQSSDVVDLVEAGDLLPVLTLWSSRPQGFENVPAVTELAPTFEPLVRMRAIAAHPEVPSERLDILRTALLQAFNSADFQANLAANSLDLVAYPTDPVAAFRAQVEIYQDFYCVELGIGCTH